MPKVEDYKADDMEFALTAAFIHNPTEHAEFVDFPKVHAGFLDLLNNLLFKDSRLVLVTKTFPSSGTPQKY